MSYKTPSATGLLLMGLKHCGKTTLGSMAARELSLPFYDLDDLVLREIRRIGYSSVRELYRTAGREKFQEYERSAAAELADSMSKGPLIAALGGGTVENPPAMELLRPMGFFLYLEVDEEELFRRISASGIPPFLEGEEPPRVLFGRLYRRRSELYEQNADARIFLPPQPIERNFARLFDYISSTPVFSEARNAR